MEEKQEKYGNAVNTIFNRLGDHLGLYIKGYNPRKGSFIFSGSYCTGSPPSIARQDAEVPFCREMIPYLSERSFNMTVLNVRAWAGAMGAHASMIGHPINASLCHTRASARYGTKSCI